jgi:hypothetical protein
MASTIAALLQNVRSGKAMELAMQVVERHAFHRSLAASVLTAKNGGGVEHNALSSS